MSPWFEELLQQSCPREVRLCAVGGEVLGEHTRQTAKLHAVWATKQLPKGLLVTEIGEKIERDIKRAGVG